MGLILTLTLLTFVALLSLAFSAGTVESSSSCKIKSSVGAYNYDPTSGKGPADWGSLQPEYEACGTGQIQSPIDFPSEMSYGPLADGPSPSLIGANFTLSSGSSNWALTCSIPGSCGTTELGGTTYTLFNIHLHSPSEHLLDGVQYPLEAHFVHSAGDKLAVIATMFKYPDEKEYSSKVYAGNNMDYGQSRFLRSILSALAADKTEFNVFPGGVIDASKGYCVYTGSLTTPPCSEGVTFMMSNNVVTASKREVFDYSVTAGASYDGNNRPVQALNDREVTCYV